MTNKISLGERMKQYESCFKQILPRRMPVIVRCDGKAFHTYTKGLKTQGVAYDVNLEQVMNLTAIKLCEKIQGAQMAYVQSDEISVLIHGYKKLNFQSWFDNELQKIVSISAALASVTFTSESWRIWAPRSSTGSPRDFVKPAYFDSRTFVLPESEVANYFIWRLKDCRKNSISMHAQVYFSHKELHKKTSNERKEMLKSVGCDWDLLPCYAQNGRIVLKEADADNKSKWVIKNDFPLFWEERQFIEQHLSIENE